MSEQKIAAGRYNSVTTSLSDAELRLLMDWIERQDPKPPRSTAVRELMLAGLDALGGPSKADRA